MKPLGSSYLVLTANREVFTPKWLYCLTLQATTDKRKLMDWPRRCGSRTTSWVVTWSSSKRAMARVGAVIHQKLGGIYVIRVVLGNYESSVSNTPNSFSLLLQIYYCEKGAWWNWLWRQLIGVMMKRIGQVTHSSSQSSDWGASRSDGASFGRLSVVWWIGI